MAAVKAIFMGSNAIALPLLESVRVAGHPLLEWVGVLTQPDRRCGRGMKMSENAVKRWSSDHGLPVIQPANFSGEDLDWLRDRGCELIVVMAYGHLLSSEVLDQPRLSAINLHASILPRHRGASPVTSAIADRCKETGVSLMRMVRQMDAGPVADCERVTITPSDTAGSLTRKLGCAAVPLMERNLAALVSGTLVFRPQDPSRTSYTRRLHKSDGAIDFSRSAEAIASRVRALEPWPGTRIEWNGTLIRIGSANHDLEHAVNPPGTILGLDKGELLIATGQGRLRCTALQRPGGRMLPADVFVRGFPLEYGSVLPSSSAIPLVSPRPFPEKPH